MPAPLFAFEGARAMTLLDGIATGKLPGEQSPATQDRAARVARTADRRCRSGGRARSTTAASPKISRACRIPMAGPTRRHSSRRSINRAAKLPFVITRPMTRSSAPAASISCDDGAPGDRLLARRAVLGPGLRHRSGARADRPCLRRPRPSGAAGRRAREQPGLAPRAGEVRLPVDRRCPHPHPRDRVGGASRPLPARPRPVGLAAELGRGKDCFINSTDTGCRGAGFLQFCKQTLP